MQLEALTETIDGLMQCDPSTRGDAASMEVIHRELARLESWATSATAAFETSGEWVEDGARNTSVWVATQCRMPRPKARRLVRRARALRHLPACAEAWSEGAVSGDHLDVLAGLRREATLSLLERDEAMLVEQARVLSYEDFVRLVAYWEQRADPDGIEADAEDRRTRRDVYLVQSFSALWLGKMTLDPVSGAIVSGELERLEKELFEQEWAEARTTLGREPTPCDLSRSTAQRRADALVEMATRSKTTPADGRRPAPLFSVLVDWETLRGRTLELAGGAVLTPGTLVPWLDQAYLERAVFGPQYRVEVGTTARLFTGATRRAIELRDRRCTHPYCEDPVAACQVDHIIPYAKGGPTTQENGRLLCGFHNRLRNQRSQRPPPDG
jgi:Domain of unknown function (DUF222)/HNH endonuclease